MQTFKPNQILEIVAALKGGQVVALPTETSYALSADSTVSQAVDKIFAIKKRHVSKALLAVVASVEMAKKYLQWNNLIEEAANKHWPGPLTIVGKARVDLAPAERLAAGVVAADFTLALRVTKQELLKQVVEQLGRPIVATSANLARQGDIYSSQQLIDTFQDQASKPDVVVMAGDLPKNEPTTIVDLSGDEPTVLRQGKIML